jgi:hypothetical protein
MRHFSSSRRRAAVACRPGCYRPQVIPLEDRVLLGDALFGALLGAWGLSVLAQRAGPAALDDALADRTFSDRETKPAALLPTGESDNARYVSCLSSVCSSPGDETLSRAPTDRFAASGGATTPGFASEPDWTQLPALGTASARLSTRHSSLGGFSSLTGNRMQAVSGVNARDTHASVRPSYVGGRQGGDISPMAVAVRGTEGAGGQSAPSQKSVVPQNYAQLPLSFEANVGQADPSVKFMAHGPGYGLYLTATDAMIVLGHGSGIRDQGSGIEGASAIPTRSASEESQTPPSVVRMQVLGGNATAAVVGEDPLPGKVNYFLGNDPSKWHTNVPTYGQVEYSQVYPGIDLVYYGSNQQLEYDFVVAPGANPGLIHLGFAGADGVAVDGQGNLVVQAGGQELVQHRPLVYQEVNGTRQEIPSAFVVSTDQSSLTTRQVGFVLGGYDASRPLVIDPVLSYSTYLGGSRDDYGLGIAADPSTGDALVTGFTESTNFPTANALQPNSGGNQDAFVARLSADGSALVFSTYLGGSGYDFGFAIALDPIGGDVLVTGGTFSRNFPTAHALQPNNAGDSNAFAARISFIRLPSPQPTFPV